MIAQLTYQEVCDLNPLEIVHALYELEKYAITDIVPNDLLNHNALTQNFTDLWYGDIYKCGVYVLFTPHNEIRYVGKSKQGFYGRLMSHLDTRFRGGWGWNAVLRKLGGERLGIEHNQLSDEDHKVDYRTLVEYKIALIEVPNMTLEDRQLGWLEKFIMKGFREDENHRLLNSRIGWLHEQQKTKPIKTLIEL